MMLVLIGVLVLACPAKLRWPAEVAPPSWPELNERTGSCGSCRGDAAGEFSAWSSVICGALYWS